MELNQFLILGLATWRVSSLLVNEAGPGDVFLRLRSLAGIIHDRNDKSKVLIPDGFLPELFSCIWCCSLWVGGIWVITLILSPTVAVLLAAPFALSALAVLVQAILEA